MTIHHLFANKKHALIALSMLLSFSGPGFAGGSRDNHVNHDTQSNGEEIAPQAAGADEQEASSPPTLDSEVSYEDRVLLRRDLDTYSRSDPSNAQIVERRRLMRRQLQDNFLEADMDNDGTLSREEATDILPQIARHFSEIDLNGDDVISMAELEQAQVRAIERQRAAEAKIDEAKEKETKEAELLAKRKNRQAAANRKRSL